MKRKDFLKTCAAGARERFALLPGILGDELDEPGFHFEVDF